MTTRRLANLAPTPEFPERGPQDYDALLAANQRREGSRPHAEGVGDQRGYKGAFAQGLTSSRVRRGDLTERPTQVYETQTAGQAHGRTKLGGLDPQPSWVMDAPEQIGLRRGSSPEGERTYLTIHAPANGGRRPNPAAIWE